MTEAYGDALGEQLEKSVFDTLAEEAASMTPGEYATTLADVVGIFDPTPTSDGIGAVLSLARGDAVGAGLSVVGMASYVGDLAKVPKIAALAPRTGKAIELVLSRSDELAKAGRASLEQVLRLDQIAAARKVAANRVRRAMLQARKGNVNCADCDKLVHTDANGKVTRRKLDMASVKSKHGQWRGSGPNADGVGTFEFNSPKILPDGRVVHSIDYKGGVPDFDAYVEGPKFDLWEVTGDADMDRSSLTRMMRETDPEWRPPRKRDFTLHHFEDGQVGFVPKVIHAREKGGAPHTGGQSMLNNDLF